MTLGNVSESVTSSYLLDYPVFPYSSETALDNVPNYISRQHFPASLVADYTTGLRSHQRKWKSGRALPRSLLKET